MSNLTITNYKELDTLLAAELNVKELKFQTPITIEGNSMHIVYKVEDNNYYYEYGEISNKAKVTEMLLKILTEVHQKNNNLIWTNDLLKLNNLI